jgi:hypothetical protein
VGVRDYEYYHGAALLKILRHAGGALELCIRDDVAKGCYALGRETVVYVKHSSKRMSPWVFTFQNEHRAAVSAMRKTFANAFVILVCNDDGVVVLAAAGVEALLGPTGTASIRAARRPRGMYEITGSGGELGRRVADCDFAELFAAAAT